MPPDDKSKLKPASRTQPRAPTLKKSTTLAHLGKSINIFFEEINENSPAPNLPPARSKSRTRLTNLHATQSVSVLASVRKHGAKLEVEEASTPRRSRSKSSSRLRAPSGKIQCKGGIFILFC